MKKNLNKFLIIFLILFILFIFLVVSFKKIEKFNQNENEDDKMINRSLNRFIHNEEDINNMGKGKSWGSRIIRGGDYGPISPDGVWAWIPGITKDIDSRDYQEEKLYPVYSCDDDINIQEEREFKCVEWQPVPKDNSMPEYAAIEGEIQRNMYQNQDKKMNNETVLEGTSESESSYESMDCNKPCTKEDREKIAECNGNQFDLSQDEKNEWTSKPFGRCEADGSNPYVCIEGKGENSPCGVCVDDENFWKNSTACSDCCKLE